MDEGLKIRLVGALVLLALLAIAWPLIFDSAEEIQLSKESQIPQPPAVQEWQAEQRQPPNKSDIGWENAAPKAKVDRSPLEESQPADGEKANIQEAGPSLREAWSVRVATLSDVANGKKLVDKLITDGFRAYSRAAESDNGDVVRIYIGPKFDKRRADSIKLRVDKLYSVKSLVVPYTPDES